MAFKWILNKCFIFTKTNPKPIQNQSKTVLLRGQTGIEIESMLESLQTGYPGQ